MKKVFFVFALLAGVAVMTGCKKDQAVMSFQAVIDRDTKTYFGTEVRPYWDKGDQVCIMGLGYSGKQTYTLSDTYGTYAKIEGVDSSYHGYYCAIYPVGAAREIGIPSNDGTTNAAILFPSQQYYIWDSDSNRQRVNMIMGAVTDHREKIFHFKNLSSILRLKVRNTVKDTIKDGNGQVVETPFIPINVSRVTVYAYGDYVTGYASVTLSKTGEPVIVKDGPANPKVNVLSLYREDEEYMARLENDGTASFDVVVPPFKVDSLNIELEMYRDDDSFIGNSDNSIWGNPKLTLDRNNIVTIELDISKYELPDYAYLAPGPTFNSLIRNNFSGYNNISFHCTYAPSNLPLESYTQEDLNNSSQWSDWVIVSDEDSPMKIYAHIFEDDSTKLQIVTHAKYMYANTNSREMFKDITSLVTINFNIDVETGFGFQTEDVTDMSYMFAGCTSLSNISDLEYSNFTNVENMSHLFEGSHINSTLILSPLNTHNLRDTGMVAMFKDVSGAGTIQLPTFTTNRVTSMRDLFKNSHARNIYINNFVISEGTELTGAFVGIGGNQYNPGTIYCTQAVEDLLSNQGADVIATGTLFARP